MRSGWSPYDIRKGRHPNFREKERMLADYRDRKAKKLLWHTSQSRYNILRDNNYYIFPRTEEEVFLLFTYQRGLHINFAKLKNALAEVEEHLPENLQGKRVRLAYRHTKKLAHYAI